MLAKKNNQKQWFLVTKKTDPLLIIFKARKTNVCQKWHSLNHLSFKKGNGIELLESSASVKHRNLLTTGDGCVSYLSISAMDLIIPRKHSFCSNTNHLLGLNIFKNEKWIMFINKISYKNRYRFIETY